MTTLDELRERLVAAEGPDRELDARIYNALFNEGKEGALGRATEGMVWICEIHFEQYGGFKVAPDYTTSLDAAIALVEAELPGWKRHSHQQDYAAPTADDVFHVALRPPLPKTLDYVELENLTRLRLPQVRATHKSEPIALLLALLSALEKESAE